MRGREQQVESFRTPINALFLPRFAYCQFYNNTQAINAGPLIYFLCNSRQQFINDLAKVKEVWFTGVGESEVSEPVEHVFRFQKLNHILKVAILSEAVFSTLFAES